MSMLVVMLSSTADRQNVSAAVFHSSLLALWVRICHATKRKLPHESSSSTTIMAAMRNKMVWLHSARWAVKDDASAW